MNVGHRELAAGRWQTFSLPLQMAHVGSEIERALRGREAGNEARCRSAYERALELLDLTAWDVRQPSRLKELRRAREALVDYFDGSNEMGSSPAFWRRYFDAFTYVARSDR
jgi:hypothetical protein